MRAKRVVLFVVLLGLAAAPAGHAVADRTRLTSVRSYCDRLDRGAADIVRAIERSDDFARSRDNLLIADLTAFRAHVRSLREVAEEARSEWPGRGTLSRLRATTRAMKRAALRLRMLSANVESEMGLERPAFSARWNQLVRGNLDPLMVAVQSLSPMPGQPPAPPPPGSGGSLPGGFVRIPGRTTFTAPAALRGQARYISIEAYGGDIEVKQVKFAVTETAFGHLTFDYPRTVRVNRDVKPGKPLLVEVDRRNVAVVGKIEVEWEPKGRGPHFGRVTLIRQ